MTYTRNISCCSNCSWSVVLTPVTTQPVVSTASSAFQTSSIGTLTLFVHARAVLNCHDVLACSYIESPHTDLAAMARYERYLHQCQHNGKAEALMLCMDHSGSPAPPPPPHPPLQLPVPTVLCHCSGPLVINVSYSNETSTFYTNFVLLEYRSDVTSYDRTLILDKAECWRQYNVSVAYQSPTGRALFSRAITLDNSELSMSDWFNLDYPHNHCSKSISICAGLT